MKSILVVFTGGTIGSTVANGTINTSDSASFRLIQAYQRHQQFNPLITFDCIQPLQILSENLVPDDWQTLIAALELAGLHSYDGVIITHGTDTLAYTACALSFYFNNQKTPILLVSSNYPLEHEEANGLENFVCAVEFIQQIQESGVFVPYQNPGQITQLHRGSRLTSSPQLTGDFFSVQDKSYMQFVDGQFLTMEPRIQVNDLLSVRLQAKFSQRILMIKPYPGLDYTRFNLEGVDAVLHDLYHSGTACVSPRHNSTLSLINWMQRCNDHGVRLYIAPIRQQPEIYHTTQLLMDHGAQIIWNSSIEAAYIKLLLAYGNFDQQSSIDRFLNSNIAAEFI